MVQFALVVRVAYRWFSEKVCIGFLGLTQQGRSEISNWFLRAPTFSRRLRNRRLAQEALHTFTALYSNMTRQVVLCECGCKHALVTGNEGRDRFNAPVS